MNLNDLARQLGTLSRDLDKAVAQLSDLEVAAVDAEATYKTKFARTWGIAASTVRVQKESLRALHARIDVGRTLASTARAEISLANSGVHP